MSPSEPSVDSGSVLPLTRRGGLHTGLDRHLFLIGAIQQCLMEDTAIETGVILDACEGQR